MRETYAAASSATLKNSLFDPYVKAVRWASDRLGEEGLIAFVTNNSFLEGLSFDGMRKCLEREFDAIYIVDLGGNARKGLKVADASVFGIRVGVSLSFFVKSKKNRRDRAKIHYFKTDDKWNKQRKFEFLLTTKFADVKWKICAPNERGDWLTEGLRPEWETFMPLGSKEVKASAMRNEAVMKTYSNGVQTNCDAWVYNFQKPELLENVKRMIETYNAEVDRWKRCPEPKPNIDDFVLSDGTKIKWRSALKMLLLSGKHIEFDEKKVRESLRRPFTKSPLYFDRPMNQRVFVFPSIFPKPESEKENQVIQVKMGAEIPMFTLAVDRLVDNFPQSGSQCFPFFVYDENGGNRRENITDWALSEFRRHYKDGKISKWDIFHYIYGLLHHPQYRERYAENLKRDLPRMPLCQDFWGFARAGKKLAELHLHYESQTPFPLGSKEVKAAANQRRRVADESISIFKIFSNGVQTNCDAWTYNFIHNELLENVKRMIETYNAEVDRWKRCPEPKPNIDDFVLSDGTKIKWRSALKMLLLSGKHIEFDEEKVRESLRRPFTKSPLYFDRPMNQRVFVFPSIFPTEESEKENQVIQVKMGAEIPMFTLAVDRLVDNFPQSGSQCFPFYTYNEDGGNRRENITDWALAEFRRHYKDGNISKWDIFHYIYGLLHHPQYRERYAENLKRDLPRMPLCEDFWGFARAGKKLAELHLHYESQTPFPLTAKEKEKEALKWRVQKMRLSKCKTKIYYNEFLTLEGIPPEVFAYRLGNRSALEWIINQYQVKTDKRSGIVNDPNRKDDPQYIVRLIGQVIAVSLETLKIIEALPSLETSAPSAQ